MVSIGSILNEHVIGDLSRNITKKKQFHQLVSICGQNLTNREVHAAWTSLLKSSKTEGVDYSEFCVYINSLSKSNGAEEIRNFFGNEIERNDLKMILSKSDAELSSKRIESFLDDCFGDQRRIPIDGFVAKFNLLQENIIENIADGKTRPMAQSLIPQFEETIGPIGSMPTIIDDREPDAVKQGAFFFEDNSAHQFEMKLTSSSNVTIQLSLNRPELNFNFFIFKNSNIEGIGTVLLDDTNMMSAVWNGDLTKGNYKIVPFPIEHVKKKNSGKSWVKISEKDKRGELRFTQQAKSAIIKVGQPEIQVELGYTKQYLVLTAL